MLDNQTKKRIDDCRDILVGKLPDPKSQIEQITIALIYKFMDDMDKESIDLGGKAKFFSGDFEKYSWDSLFNTKVTANEMLKLYSESIESMEKNPNIPQLFRNIFKNAYLPYRDPETLKLFLKTIGEFEYTHSEKLGDAFEYLLSVMGSQGDAGQFRTPRHIIDFLVKAVDPDKTNTILDPACGTAGFLISAFKRIKEKSKDSMNRVSTLTPDDRKKLIKNFIGYDISPDMVRLSLVNLYLHGFSDPHIHEYDTLTSEERWNDNFDVILANPPFMSPKGGIRPHKKFTVTSNRSEVLFVDYIAEHLNPNGRAGIIVPEGVIFQSGKAYKELRKMLVENYLYAVVSLPAGVFNPYSGVKTSILLIDKTIAKKSNKILFVKIDNDGYNLGAQRSAIKGGQLEEAIKIIHDFVAGETLLIASQQEIAHTVEKSKIAENGEFNLSGERYKETNVINSNYEFVQLPKVCKINPETLDPSTLNNDEFAYIDISSVENGTGKVKYDNLIKVIDAPSRARRKVQNKDVVLSTVRPNLKAFGYIENPSTNTIASTGFAVLRAKENLNARFLLYNLFADGMVNQMISMMGKGAYPSINQSDVSSLNIPLPPLSIQEEIVAEIEGYQKIIDGAKMVVENYKPQIDIDPDWKMVELGGLADNLDGKRVPITKSDRTTGQYPYYGASGIVDYVADYIFDEDILLISEDGANLLARVTPIAFSVSGKVWVNNHAHVLKFKQIETQKYVEIYLNSISLESYITGSAQPKLNQKFLNSIKIPLPEFEIQNQIVTLLEKEKELVNSSKQLIEIFEQKIKDSIAKVWGTSASPNTTEDKKEEKEEMRIAAEPEVEYQRK